MTEMQPWQAQSFLHPDLLASAWRLFVGYDEGVSSATAGAFVTEAMTMVEFVSVRSEMRGKSYGTAITAAAALAERDRPALLIASDAGRGIYERLGFLPLLRETVWLGKR